MEVTAATFNREVIEASNTVPVVVDFWAPWCGPCRSLGPTLDQVAEAFGGRVKLVKIDTDQNPELSQAFNIRSIPNVIAFKGGRPVAQFLGARPEPQVREFFAQLLPSPGEEAMRTAEAAFADGRVDDAARLLAEVPHDVVVADRIAALERGITFARLGTSGANETELREQLGFDPLDHDTRVKLASVLASQRRFREALEELLEAIRLGRHTQAEEARAHMLSLFTMAAANTALVDEYRRKLASIMP